MRHNGPFPTSRRERGVARRRRERRRLTVVGVLAAACVVTIALLVARADGAEPARAVGPTSIVASAAASHGMAGPPSPRSASVPDDHADSTYLDLLDRADVTYESRDEIVRTGHGVCTFLGAGGTVTGARMLVTPYRLYSPEEGNAIVTAARSAYCPERRTTR